MISSFHISLRLLMSGFFIGAFSLSASSAIAQSKPGRIVWKGYLEHQHSYADAYNGSRAQNTVKFRYVEETDSNGNTRLVEQKIHWSSSGQGWKKGATIFDLRSGQYMRRFTGDCSVTCEQSPRGGGEVDLLSDDGYEKLKKLKPQCKVTPSPDDYQCLYLHNPNVWDSIGSDIINMVPIPWEKLRDNYSYSEEKLWTDSSGRHVQRFSVWASPQIDGKNCGDNMPGKGSLYAGTLDGRIYSEPSTNSTLVGSPPSGTRLRYTNTTQVKGQTWYYIQSPGRANGWMPGSQLSCTRPEAPPVPRIVLDPKKAGELYQGRGAQIAGARG